MDNYTYIESAPFFTKNECLVTLVLWNPWFSPNVSISIVILTILQILLTNVDFENQFDHQTYKKLNLIFPSDQKYYLPSCIVSTHTISENVDLFNLSMVNLFIFPVCKSIYYKTC